MSNRPEILLLGELALGDGSGLPASKKTRALLGFLAATGQPHTREELCDLLWQGPDDPRAALRWSLSKLRGVLGAEAIQADRERVSLGNATTDLGALDADLAGGVEGAPLERLLAARGRFRGEFLEGLLLADCHRFHQWSTAERERARALRIVVLAELAARSKSDPEQALVWARERVTIDPLAESAHVEVVALLAALGRKRDALAQFEMARHVLEREGGVRPGPALLEARMKLGQSSVSVPVPLPVASPPSRPPSTPPLVGRSAELELVGRAARGGVEQVLVLLGEPGIGKTRLLDELSATARAQGGTVLAGRAFEAEMGRPYGPWIDALGAVDPSLVPEPLAASVAPLAPERDVPMPIAQDRGSLFDAVARLVAHLSNSGPLAIVLDDLQWCDEASTALFHYVARGADPRRVVLACAARPGELEDNPAALRLLRTLARDGRLQRVELGPLDLVALTALARSVTSGAAVERVVADSGGNPLFALELARAARKGRSAALDSLDGLIADRIAGLDEPTRELLGWAAAFGTPFDLRTLERVTGLGPIDISTRVAELERHGLVRALPDGSAHDFAHDLVRAGAYRQLSEPRRRAVHQFIARALDAQDDANASRAGEVAHHAALAGDAELAARAALRAARRCLRVFAGAEAARLADLGRKQLELLPRLEKLRYEVAFLTVLVLSGAWAERLEPIKRELTRAIAAAQDAGLTIELVDGLEALAILLYDGGDLGGAHGAALHALETVGEVDPRVRARQLGNSARCLAMLERDLDQAIAMHDEALELCAETNERIVSVEWAGAMLSAFVGRFDDALKGFERVLELARLEEDRWAEYECLRALVQLEIEGPSSGSPGERLGALLDVARKMGDGSAVSVARALEALLRLRSGEPNADDAVERAIRELREVDAKGMLAYTLTIAAEADLAVQRFGEAGTRAEEALACASAVGRRTQTTLARAILARIALGRGDPEAGRAHFDAALRDLAEPSAVSARARTAILSLEAAFSR